MARFVSSFAILLAFVTACIAAVYQVEEDIANIASQVTVIDSAIHAFPTTGGSLLEALEIHELATTLASALASTTTDVVATGPVDDTDGQTILKEVEAFEPTIIDALISLAQKVPAFSALPLGGVLALIKQDVVDLDAETKNLENAMIADTPADLLAQAASITSAIDAAFATVGAAFADT
ncbi:hydrophobic surface binding protein [Gymnopus androsaceus JB14]|uniref:Hydrophobic surface binding protein n=1 Tax=Gymnopus androsaceus JB14 TaxID=1447944 RepID=A0A6A4H2F9_9AGAR|nr:hydrophobic surface binding protein [Gymnopus androsaceus JB14]